MRTNPYPGLRPFGYEDAEHFFGRHRAIDELLVRLERRRFVAVVGTSGSGKSSLVRAGLIPALEGGLLAKVGSRWRVATFRPQGAPMRALADALSEAGLLDWQGIDRQETAEVIEAGLRRSTLGLVETVRRARLGDGECLLVVVDQFEEFFRFPAVTAEGPEKGEDAEVVRLLLEAGKQRTCPVYVAITIRSDYLGECDRYPGLPEQLSRSQYLVPRLTRDELASVIRGPAQVRGVAVAEGLVQQLQNEVGDDMNQLPVLQHALMRTWECWSEREDGTQPIATEDLERAGGMKYALSRHAHGTFLSLGSERERGVAERVFRALCERGAQNRDFRRPAMLGHLCAVVDAPAGDVMRVIERFREPGRAFLLPPAGIPLSSASVIDIAHESLIRLWVENDEVPAAESLREWVVQEATSARVYLRLREAARAWRERTGGLWREPDLTFAREWRQRERPNEAWAARYEAGLGEALEFLEESEAAQREEVAREQGQVAKLQRAVARARQLSASLGGALGIVLLVVLVAWGYHRERDDAYVALEGRLRRQAGSADGAIAAEALLDLTDSPWDIDAASLVPEARDGLGDWFAGVSVGMQVITAADSERRRRAVKVGRSLADAVFQALGSGGAPSLTDDTLLNKRIFLQGGQFAMGSDAPTPAVSATGSKTSSDRPAHTVTVADFFIQQHEVTNREFRRFRMGHAQGQPEDAPAVNVTWYDAVLYAAWLGGELPTEAQWELAARGKIGRTYPWGDEDPSCERARAAGCRDITGRQLRAVAAVNQLRAGDTPEGVADLAGNALEWCRDWYGPYEESESFEPLGQSGGYARVLRGGSLNDNRRGLQASFRNYSAPGKASRWIGFRVVWSSAAAGLTGGPEGRRHSR